MYIFCKCKHSFKLKIPMKKTRILYWSQEPPELFNKNNVFLEISENSQAVSFLVKLHVEACNVIKKETLTQVFSYEF